jgi:nicotinate-nucleotide adenylyltransferase
MAEDPVRIGVFGGTFDPVHLGHLIIAEELRYRLRLDCVLFLPARQPPHKTDREITPEAHRVAMLQLALAGNPSFTLSTVDLDRPGPSYTADSLEILHQDFPESTLFFLMGQDSLRDLPTWHDPNRIARQAYLAVALRPDVTLDVEAVVRQVPEARGRIEMVSVPLIGISSQSIRQRVREGLPIRYQVPLEVERYIEQQGLYRSR